VEMIARVLKHNINNLLRKEMRRLKITGEQPYIKAVITKLNKIFGTGAESEKFWGGIPKMLETNFPDSGKGLPKDLKRDLEGFKIPFNLSQTDPNKEKPNGICLLFHVLSERCRLSWRGSVKDEFVHTPSLYSVQNPFSPTDLAALDEKVKRTQLIGHSQGVILRMQGISSQHRGKYAEILLNQALVKFRQSLQAVPRNQRTLRNVGDVFHHLHKNGLAELFYRTAIEAMAGDAISLYKYAYFMDTILKDYEAAETYYILSNKCRMTTGNVLAYAKFLRLRGRNENAAELLQQAINKFPNNSLVYHHSAQFHHKVQGNYDLAESYYRKALELGADKPTLLKDFSDFLQDIRKDGAASAVMMKKYDDIVSQSHMLGGERSYRLGF